MPKPTRPASRALDMLTVADAAAELRLCDKTVLRRIKDGALRAHRLGRSYRIAREDLVTFVSQHRL